MINKFIKYGSALTILATLSTAVYFVEDRYVLKVEHEAKIESVKTTMQNKMEVYRDQGYNRIDHMSKIHNMRMIDMELGLINLSIESMLNIPEDHRGDKYVYEMKELELKRQFLIEHKTQGSLLND